MCCGGTRHRIPVTATGARPAQVIFQYVGQTALTVVGPASGISYRFEQQGARVAVDIRDRQALSVIRVLRALG
jgi:hypothetical protein